MNDDDELRRLPQHYEFCLGVIARAWTDKSRRHGVDIVAFDDCPERGVSTFATLGFAYHVLAPVRGRHIRQEFLLCGNADHPPEQIARFLLTLAEQALRSGEPMRTGQVLGPSSPLIDGATVEAVFVAASSPFPDELDTFPVNGDDVHFRFLVPVTRAELELVATRGWRWFQEALETQNPDIWDFARSEGVR